MADDVLDERLKRAGMMLRDLAPVLGEQHTWYVIEMLGLDTYTEAYVDDDGRDRWRLRNLTNLQTIALAAAMLAFKEYLEDRGWLT